MKPGRIAAWAITAVAVPGLAACSGSSSGGTSPAAASSPAAANSPGQSQAAGQPAAQGRLTPPGTRLAFGGEATVGWVPPAQATGNGAHEGIKLRITVVSIQKGTMADFRNVELNGNQRNATPYYVQLRVTALSSTLPPKDSDPAITFTAIDVLALRRPVSAEAVRERQDLPELPGLPDPWRRLNPEGPVGQRAVRGEPGD